MFNCEAINMDGLCTKCECSYLVHMHVYYMTKVVNKKVPNTNAVQNVKNKQKLVEEGARYINELVVLKKELEQEHSTIITTCAKFTHFLQENAITPFNDSYKEYIEYLISR